ncbi:hypothetical protein AArcSl_1656 [Halalkaliarchaeum desulfuricum]|uniref:Uncharacterized protein n=1 Tax=Halalkaliarchaeum desulfuricum TaxID=2055893 RepID=A0A343TJL3_9EURY|nr:hypothetical protein [Halalkaliarchaeum desulfuricum]AUX09285.1 hypothetical protein AArcSl_1656 [Halalkaliarchaeum desulfuricum]
MLDRITRLEQNVRYILESDAVDFEDKQDASAKLEEIDQLAGQIHRDKPFERFLQQYIARAHRDYQSGDREEPLCRCSYAECDLKQGRLPGRVRTADSLQGGIDEFQERHPESVVLLEAREEWLSVIGEYRQILREVYADLEQARAEAEPRYKKV